VEYKIIRIPVRNVNVYLVIAGGKGIIVDAGIRKHSPEVYATIRKHGLEPEDIRFILLTHTHFDHVRGLKEIKEKTGAKILVHSNEAPSLSKGYTDIPPGTITIGKIFSFLGRKVVPFIGAYPPVTPDIITGNRYDIADLGIPAYVIHTPGHTSGSVSFIIDNECAFVGDCMLSVFRKSILPAFAEVPATLIKSWQVLLDTGCRIFYPGHRDPISRQMLEDNLEKFRYTW